MFCPNCGNQISGGAKFCVNCGWKKKKGIQFKVYYLIILLVLFVFGIITLRNNKGIRSLSHKKQLIAQIENLCDIADAAKKYWYNGDLGLYHNNYVEDYVGVLSKRKNSEQEEKEYTITLGNYKGENIKWMLLYKDDNKAYMISKYILDVVPYELNVKEGKDILQWSQLSLRKFANNEFYNNAFSDEDKQLLCEMGSRFPKPKNPDSYITTSDYVLTLRDDMYEKVMEKAQSIKVDEDVFKAWATDYAINTGLLIGNNYIGYNKNQSHSFSWELKTKESDYPNGECWYYMCGGKLYGNEFAVQYINSAGKRCIDGEWSAYSLMILDSSLKRLRYMIDYWPADDGYKWWNKRWDKTHNVICGFRPVICIDLK